jgi:Zn-finger nucleic acid-binding protein
MKCPTCDGVDLVMTERQNVEIDYCPKCRGVWLDRGELDKIIERSAVYERTSQPAPEPRFLPSGFAQGASGSPSPGHGGYSGQTPGQGEHQDQSGYDNSGNRRKSFLSDLFD